MQEIIMTVFIPQVMDYNVRSAEKFGELEVMLPDRKQLIFSSSSLENPLVLRKNET